MSREIEGSEPCFGGAGEGDGEFPIYHPSGAEFLKRGNLFRSDRHLRNRDTVKGGFSERVPVD